MSEKPDIYLIHPVRNITTEERKFLDDYVNKLEAEGHKVHYPIRDVNQEQTGLDILTEHKTAMKTVKEVHVYWSQSTGSLFDFGMAFITGKPIVLVNKEQIKRTPHKSFENVLLELDNCRIIEEEILKKENLEEK